MFNDSENYLYSFIIPLISTILGLFGILTAGGVLPGGQRRAGIMLFFSFCTVSFLLFMLQTLPLSDQISDILMRLTFFCFISIPVIFNITIIRKRESAEYIDWFAAISVVMLLLFSFLYAVQNTLPIFFIYIPMLIICIFHSFKVFRESITPRQQAANFRGLCIQILLGITPPVAFLLSLNWQEASLLIFIIPLWAMLESWKIKSGKHNEDYSPEIAAQYAAPAIMLTILLLVFRGATELSDHLKGLDFTFSIRPALVALMALTGTILFEPLKEYLRKIINIISRRYMDDFTSILNGMQEQRTLPDPEDIPEHLSKFFPDIYTSILFRLPFKKVFKVSYISSNPFFDITDSLIIGGKMLQAFEKDGYSILTPNNIENYGFTSTFMEKALSVIEKSDILLIPLFDPPDEFPALIFAFLQNGKSSFPPNVIRNLYRWVKAVKSPALSLWKRLEPEKIELSDEFMQILTPNELTDAAEKLLSLQTPLRKFNIIIIEENTDDSIVFSLNSEIPEEIIAEVTGVAKSKTYEMTGNKDKINSKKNREDCIKIENHRIILRIPSSGNAQHFAYLEFDKEIFHYTPSAGKAFNDFSARTGLLLDKLSISKDLEEHRELVEALEKKVDTERLKVAEDLHDTVAQEMFAAKMLAELLEKQLRESSPQTGEDIRILRSAVDEGLRKTRAMIVKLRDVDTVKTENIIGELKKFSDKVESETGIKITFENLNVVESLSDNTTAEISMIIREGINNARKHSGAISLNVKFSSKGNEIYLKIQDNGKGFLTDNAINKDSFGIAGMKSRCSRLGGKLEVISSPGKGTVILATISRTATG